jgi:NADH-quinone oxidoreductase subunit E
MSQSSDPGTHRRDPAKWTFIDNVIVRYRGRPGALLAILEAVQERNPRKYLCADELRYIAQKTSVPLARIFSVATFYALFNLDPQGDHTICICRGTACHARGSRTLLDTLRLELGLQESAGEHGADKLMLTTPDRKFTIRTVACFGQCALAPVVELDHRICGHMNEGALVREVGALTEEAK